MKKQFLNIFAVMAFGAVMVSCQDKAKEAETTEAEAVAEAEANSVKYTAVADESTIEWKGFKPTGSHTGNIAIENGVITVKGGMVESGTFLIDMSSIENTDIPESEEGNAKLVGHLKSPDFFDVEKFPTAAFEVTGMSEKDGKMMLSGNLGLKGEKNNVTFPVNVSESGDMLTITSEPFTIDRSKWNVKYGSKSFFDDLGDNFINDDIELTVNLKAKKS